MPIQVVYTNIVKRANTFILMYYLENLTTLTIAVCIGYSLSIKVISVHQYVIERKYS